MSLSYLDIAIRLTAALLCGLILGRERKLKGKPVGSRTHIIVCLAAAMVTIISAYGFEAGSGIQRDPARLVVGILTGIGFIGAGIIWKDNGGDIHGITTAANVFMVACLGIAIGLGYYFLAAVTTLLAFATLEYPNFKRKLAGKKAKKQAQCKNVLPVDDQEDVLPAEHVSEE